MSEAIKLSAQPREGKVADPKLVIPGVVYGSGMETTSLSVNRIEFEKVFAQSGESGLISLSLEGGDLPVIIKAFQMDPVKHRVIHVDFYQVNMKEKVVAEVSLDYIGEAPAVKTHGGIVVKNFDTIEIECLPKDLMQKIEVDLSKLENIGDAIHLSDIVLPAGVVFKHDPADMLVQVVEPKKQVEEAPVEEAEAAPVADAKPEEAKPEENK